MNRNKYLPADTSALIAQVQRSRQDLVTALQGHPRTRMAAELVDAAVKRAVELLEKEAS